MSSSTIIEINCSKFEAEENAAEMWAELKRKMEAQEKLITVLKEQLADARRPFKEQYDERIAEIHTHYEEEYVQGGEEYERIKDEIREEISEEAAQTRDDIRDELKQEIWNM